MTVAPDWWLTQSHRSQSLRSSGNTTGTSLSRVFGYCANVHNTNPVEISSAGESRIREMFMGNTWNDRRRASFAPSFTINSSQQPSRQRARWGAPYDKARGQIILSVGGRRPARQPGEDAEQREHRQRRPRRGM
jgi:hypothetical protein